ncbi:MAG TPA: ATP-binding protein [Solirubrobacteraceae bacterium]|nr:ATP-binding protein [Solirubrobacteraceae bacterium]
MRRREAVAALIAGALIILALLAVFAVDLSNNQARSRGAVEAQAHQRAVLVAGLIDSVFGAVSRPGPQPLAEYSRAVVPNRVLERNRGSDVYLVLLDANGRVLASSRGFTPQARAGLATGAHSALAMIRAGQRWALGNVEPYGDGGVVDFASRISTPLGPRILVRGLRPDALTAFTTNDLEKVPGVNGAHHLLLDGNGIVIASTNPKRPPGYHFHTPTQIKVLTHPSGSVRGHYFDQVPLGSTTWRVLLAAPESEFFASVSGTNRWLPWLIFGAFAFVALVALALAARILRSNDLVVEANAQLAESNAELERRARELARSNAELEQFASIASHDLQEPLRKVRTFTERVRELDADTLSDRGLDYLQRANTSAERMQRLIEDLLVFSRVAMQTRPFTPVDLGQVTHDVLEDLDDLVRRSGARVTVGALPTINADAPQMRQLMQNLISNALKFRREDTTPEVDISAATDGDWVTIVVRDNGIGFETQYARRIFRVFERLHGRGAYPGTGIGLALCRKIADRHGGSVRAQSIVGEGSTFTVRLPINRTEAVSEAAPHGGEPIEHEEPYVAV